MISNLNQLLIKYQILEADDVTELDSLIEPHFELGPMKTVNYTFQRKKYILKRIR